MDALAAWLDRAEERLGAGASVRVTPRELLELVGAKRRGTRVVRDIQARMARRDLGTEPSFDQVDLDQAVTVIRDGELPLHLERLKEARRRVDADERPLTVTVRELLGWFGVERRGTRVVDEIESSLWGYELLTEPEFTSTALDAQVQLLGWYQEPRDVAQGESEHPPPPSEWEDRTNFLVGALPQARRAHVVSSNPQAPLSTVVSTMMTHGVSFLPVIHGRGEVRGVVRWKEVAEHLSVRRGSNDDQVEKFMTRAEVVKTTDPLLHVIPAILKYGCVLVRDEKNLISGIVTKTNLGEVLSAFSRPFVLLERIEVRIRSLIERAGFTPNELQTLARDEGDDRPVTTVDNLTLGEYKRLLERDDAWRRIDIGIDRKPFIAQLGKVRFVRNRVMHFSPDSPTADDIDTLERFVELLEELARVAPEKC